MSSESVVRGFLYVSLTVVGVPGNSAIIVAFLLSLYQESRLQPADAILLFLASANLVVVGVRTLLLETLETLQIAHVFDNAGCKAVNFIYRLSRSLSIWLTFILSAYQCLSIAPPGSHWATVRSLVAQYLWLIFFCVWAINTSISTSALLFITAKKNISTVSNHGIYVKYCHARFPSKQSKAAVGAAQVTRDAVPMALMALTSLIILVFLYKHSKQVRGLRSSSGGGGGGSGGAEQRAAKAVVALVTLYVVLYGVDNALWVYTLTVKKTVGLLLISDLRIFFSALYAAVSPLLVIASNRKVNNRLRCRGQKKPLLERATTVSTI
ncbi:olfactory receptor class A related 2 [Genypterus blacodes]|uniref:olfactory receptor class A related 2 n=1 Tax=Genypterus blacodes TaxID=154954 RepID=UPI003F76BB33